MMDHVTFTVDSVSDPKLVQYMGLLGFTQFPIENHPMGSDYEKSWEQKWFSDGSDCDIHIVQHQDVAWGLSHLCVVVGADRFDRCRRSEWCTRDAGTGRCWLEGPGGIRAEVRPHE